MRRKEREVTDESRIKEIILACGTCRVALNTGEAPYIVPLSFGYEENGGLRTLYFHGAQTGMKYELLSKNNKVCFEMDCGHMLFTDMEKGNCTMCYESVIGYGVLEDVPEEGKREALDILMEHYPVPAGFHYNEAVVAQTRVLKLTVESMTGKRREKK